MLTYEKLEKGIFLLRSDSLISNGILIENIENSGNLLIDCNFNHEEIQTLNDSLYKIFVLK